MTVVVERTFRVMPADHAEFERLSREDIWPFMEARGCKIVGLFRQLHGGRNDELVLLTAYASMAHWEATRPRGPVPDDVTAELRELQARAGEAVRKRQELVTMTRTRVLQPATEWVDYSVRG